MDTNLADKTFRVHGVRVHALQASGCLAAIDAWLREKPRRFHYLVSTNINNIVMAVETASYATVMENADMSVPDGVPLLWVGRTRGFRLPQRCGIEEVMLELFEISNMGYNYSHYFYGNTPEVLAAVEAKLKVRYPKLNIAGTFSPPFRPLTPREDEEHVQMINDANPDFLWVSLGCPKQEIWLFEHREVLRAALGGGAGAVFNFLSGHTPKAPGWLQHMGLEWLMRLALEPKRLWRRYLLKYPSFLYYFIRPPRGAGRPR